MTNKVHKYSRCNGAVYYFYLRDHAIGYSSFEVHRISIAVEDWLDVKGGQDGRDDNVERIVTQMSTWTYAMRCIIQLCLLRYSYMCATYRRPNPNAALFGSRALGSSWPFFNKYLSGLNSRGSEKTAGSCKIDLYGALTIEQDGVNIGIQILPRISYHYGPLRDEVPVVFIVL